MPGNLLHGAISFIHVVTKKPAFPELTYINISSKK